MKPVTVYDYSIYMGEVDKNDHTSQLYLLEWKRSFKYYVKWFNRLFN